MGTHELQTELDEIVDTMATDFSTDVQEKFSNLSAEDAAGVARLDIALRMILPSASDKKTAEVRNAFVEQLAAAGIEWAERFKKASIETYRPYYDKALAADVPPAPVIAANAEISLTEARVITRAFVKADKEAARNAAPATTQVVETNTATDEDDDNGMSRTGTDPFDSDKDANAEA